MRRIFFRSTARMPFRFFCRSRARAQRIFFAPFLLLREGAAQTILRSDFPGVMLLGFLCLLRITLCIVFDFFQRALLLLCTLAGKLRISFCRRLR